MQFPRMGDWKRKVPLEPRILRAVRVRSFYLAFLPEVGEGCSGHGVSAVRGHVRDAGGKAHVLG